MSDEHKSSQAEAVREPEATGQPELAAAVEHAEPASDVSATTEGRDSSGVDSSPLGAYRRDRQRTKIGESSAEMQPVPSATLADPSTTPEAAAGSTSISGSTGNDAAQYASSDSPDHAAPSESAGSERHDEAGERPGRGKRRSTTESGFIRATGAVEVPPPVQHLDADLAAEIDAAMARSELQEPEAVPSAAVEGDVELAEKPPEDQLEKGQHLTGKIQSIHGDGVFLDLGYRSNGMVPMRQFVSGKKPEVGQLIEVLVDHIAAEEGLIYLNLPKGLRRIAGNWDSLSKGQIVDCLVNRTNKGGLEVTVSGLRAFLPSSQVELGFVADLESYIGQKLRVEVVEVNPKKRNLVVSRRAYLQIERKELEGAFWQTAQIGQTFTGKVKTIKDYGVFVDLGAVDGFLHIGEMSWQRIKHPSELVKEGQTVDVKVVSLDAEKHKVGLGMKQLAQNPWTTAAEKYPANSTVSGKVTRIADFGAFVELEPGLEGLIHVSELDHKRIRHTSDVLKVHQIVTAQVLEVDTERKRISLSLKALQAKPEEPKPQEETPAEAYQRKHKGPLRGGTGRSEAGGGLFGKPSDYS